MLIYKRFFNSLLGVKKWGIGPENAGYAWDIL